MKNILVSITALLLSAVFAAAKAQTITTDFRVVDEYVKSLGALDTLNAGTISYVVTKKFPSNTDKLRAIFDWIAYNISFDCKAARNNGNEKTTGDEVLKTRKTTSSGYAALFQDMCSVAKIRCLTVDGYARYSTEDINEVPDHFNHSWVVVQLGESPESWYYVDPTWGSGYTDEKMTTFTREYNDAYFFSAKQLFNYQHFPDNKAWLLGPGTRSLKDFFSMPVIKHNAWTFGLTRFTPQEGLIKAKTSTPVGFSLRVNPDVAIEIVSLQIGEGKKKMVKTADYTNTDGQIHFNYKFEEEDTYPVVVLINNKPVLAYNVEITE